MITIMLLSGVYWFIGLIMASIGCCGVGFVLCVFVAVFSIFRYKWAWLLMLGYSVGAFVCLLLIQGLLYLVGTLGDHTNYKMQALLLVGLGFPGILSLAAIPAFIKIARRQTRGLVADDHEMREKSLRSIGFRKGEKMEAYCEHLEDLSQESRDAIKDAYLRENLTDPLERSAQEALRLWRSGQRLHALELYNLAVKGSPENSILLLNRGQLQLELGNVSEALRDFDSARAGHPRLPDRFFVMQESLQTMSPEALELFIQRRKNEKSTA